MQRSRFARFFNGLGYLALYVQCAWLFLLFLPAIMDSKILVPHDTQPAPSSASHVVESFDPMLSLFLATIIAITVIIFTVYALAKSPRIATDTGEDVTTRAADLVLPLVARHRKLSQKKRRELSLRVQYFIKTGLCILMFLLILTTAFVNAPLSLGFSLTIGFILLPWGILWFYIAYVLNR
jgi:hypothetical protein